MPRGLFNWSFDDTVRFLKDRGFRLNHVEGSHYFYIGVRDGILRQACVPFHGRAPLKPRTLKGIIAQSGIPQAEWLAGR